MRHLSSIVISLTTLVLLVFGAGGVGFEKCACSGKVSFLSLNDGACCPTNGSCMTVTTVHVSDSTLTDHVDLPQMPSLTLVTEAVPLVACPPVVRHGGLRVSAGFPPPRYTLTTVLRV